jgi:hypothetical protein
MHVGHHLMMAIVKGFVSVKVWRLPEGNSNSYKGPRCDIDPISVSATITIGV